MPGAIDRHRPWCTWLRCGFGAVMAAAIAVSAPACAQPRITEDGILRIASWNLSEAILGDGAPIVAEEPAKSWRNTFGAERRVAPKPTFAGERLRADVVLLQGVRSVRDVRQLFPARDWKLVLSRQVLEFGGGRLNSGTRSEGRQTITAVALRYQRDLRLTALEHLSDLTDEAVADEAVAEGTGSGTGSGTLANAPTTERGGVDSRRAAEPVPDGLAVRLVHGGKVFWAVSAELPSRCRDGNPATPCAAGAKLSSWAQLKRAEGFGVVIGGKLNPDLRRAGPNGACASQEIVADRVLGAKAGADTVAGCVAFVDLGS